ncbi:MAG: outer membrane protein assembly factor BamE [Omnitrophica bacterium]|nr:outer membrane protein assembly factor BamE [Candidatus Omnitrophota bacterium]
MKRFLFIVCSLLLVSLVSCAEIKPPSPGQILRQPLGESPLRVGMTKEKIKSLWGKPDVVRVLEPDAQGAIKEEWIYRGRYPNLPINVDYLSETQYLFFDGNHLVKFYHQK